MRISCSVTFCGVPSVVTVEKKLKIGSPSPFEKATGMTGPTAS